MFTVHPLYPVSLNAAKMAEFVSLFMILLLLCVISAIKLTDRQRFEADFH